MSVTTSLPDLSRLEELSIRLPGAGSRSTGDLDSFGDGVEPPRFSAVRLGLLPLSADGRLAVVGESYYQQALCHVAAGRAFGRAFDEHLPVVAVLVPEPANPWDGNAVRVDVVLGDQSVKVGYLASGWAARYQPELLRLRVDGLLGTCPARITGGGTRYYGIYLHVAGPDELFSVAEPRDPVVAEATDTEVLLRDDWSCTVTKEEHHQDVLGSYAPARGREYRAVVAALGFCAIESGKYRGLEAIEVRLGGRRVGQLTYAMTERYRGIVAEFLGRGLAVTCSAFTVHTAKGVELELRLPPDPNRPARRDADAVMRAGE